MNFLIGKLLLVALLCLPSGYEARKKKQNLGTGLTFAFPGLNLLAGNGNNNNGNFLGGQTFTRTIISTVATITTASFRTCTTIMAMIPPCAASPVGRRKREAQDNAVVDLEQLGNDGVQIEPTAAIALIIGTTTLTDPLAVSEYLVANQPSTNSIIYPHDVVISEIENMPSIADINEQPTTSLYPSNDNQQDEESANFDQEATTEHNLFAHDENIENEETTPNIADNDLEDKARVGLGKTTTVTTIIRVTSVASTLAVGGATATLTVSYGGCAPPTYPYSGIPCVP